MRHKRILTVSLAVLALVSCNRDPNVAKQKYLETGNKYFDRGNYKSARLMYKDAIQKDRLFGPAYYKLGLTELKLGAGGAAVQAFQRAIDLLPKTSPDRWTAVVKISEMYLMSGDQKQFLDEVANNCEQLLQRDPNSFDGHRLKADLNFRYALNAARTARQDEFAARLDDALAEYRKAYAVKPDVGVTMQMARSLAYKQNYAAAEQLYKDVLGKDKTLKSAYFELYRLYANQNKVADAEQILKQAFANNPKDYDYLVAQARFYATLRRSADMLGVLQQIKAHAKDYPAAYLTVGDFYFQFQDGDAAIKEYKEGIDKDPKQKLTYQKRIVEVLMKQGKRSDAGDINAQILKESPSDNDAKAIAATLMLDKGEVNQALIELQAAVTRAPNNGVQRFQLGRAHAMRNEPDLARQEFQKAIELLPAYIEPRMALADLQLNRGEYDGALKTSNDILRIERNHYGALLVRAAALIGMKKYTDARTLLDAMQKAAPNSPDVLYQLGLLDMYQLKYKEAEAAFRKSYDLNPANARGLMGVVEVYMAQNKPDQALEVLQAEAAKTPNRMEFRLGAGSIALRAGKFDLALSEFQKVLDAMDKTSKARGEVFLRIGETYRRKGDDASALAAFQKAREILPDNDLVLSSLGLTMEKLGRWTEAKQLYEAALKNTPNNGVVLNNLAMLIADHGGDLEDALTKAQRAKQLMPNMPEVSDTLGWIYLKKNLSDSALDIFRGLTAQAPNRPTFRYHLGVALQQKGEKANAIREFQQALKDNPERDEKEQIQQALARLGG
ncbi:MAG TPA: tetratricopeptide repeat protein [Bryobacteraceae bacterium]|nr:tetratricopeptide repeat protein [Bryobacteraceae bacterium]